MPIISVSGGPLDSRFNAALTRLKATYKHGFKLFRKTMLDELAILDVGDSSVPKTQLGLLIEGSTYEIVSLTADTNYSENPPKIISECEYARMNLFGIQWSKLVDDRTRAMIVESMPSLAGKPVQAPLLEILKMLATNPTCLYDNLAFFHASHLVDPWRSKSGTAPNLITAALDTDGWNTFLDAVISRPDPGSDIANKKLFMPNRDLSGDNLVIYCSTPANFSALRNIFDPKSFFSTVAGGSETRKAYTQATVQLCPEMRVDAAHANYVYVAVNNTPNRGVYARIPHAPKIDETKDGSDVEVNNKVKHVNGFQTWGCTTCFPFALYKWKFS